MSISLTYKDLYIGQTVYHRDIYDYNEPMTIVGIREHSVELLGDYSGGTNGVSQSDWMPIDGVRDVVTKVACQCINITTKYRKLGDNNQAMEELVELFRKHLLNER